jgi:hypothetical protein
VESLELVSADLDEGHAVKDASPRRRWVSGPHHLRLNIDGALVRLKAETQGCQGLEALGQFHTGAPYPQVAGPAHPDPGGRGISCLVQERELNPVSGELASVQRFGHAVASSDIREYSYRRVIRKEDLAGPPVI